MRKVRVEPSLPSAEIEALQPTGVGAPGINPDLIPLGTLCVVNMLCVPAEVWLAQGTPGDPRYWDRRHWLLDLEEDARAATYSDGLGTYLRPRAS